MTTSVAWIYGPDRRFGFCGQIMNVRSVLSWHHNNRKLIVINYYLYIKRNATPPLSRHYYFVSSDEMHPVNVSERITFPRGKTISHGWAHISLWRAIEDLEDPKKRHIFQLIQFFRRHLKFFCKDIQLI